MREALPLDPPLGPRNVWDALSDSVWGGLHELRSPRAVIVWPDALPVSGTEAEADFRIALEVLRETAATLADGRLTCGRPTQVSIYVAPVSCGEETAPTEGLATVSPATVTT